jgi:2-C-methyl-D-erythritol 2,4-cyclodiphosphate synthase
MPYRCGIGHDIHRLKPGIPLFLGGVEIPSAKGAEGHSDADVLIHAICDALLGAAALGDIGTHFPDTDPELKGADSRIILRKVVQKVVDTGCSIVNIDTIIFLEKPKLQPLIPAIRESLSFLCGLTADKVSVKAKTSESIGFIGREEGIAAQAVVMISMSDQDSLL